MDFEELGGRMISAQADTEFSKGNYQDLKKVYSIWICMNAPKNIGNAMTRFSIKKEDLVGNTPDNPRNYDKLSVLLIYLDREADTNEKNMFHLLNVLFSTKIEAAEKERILQNEFDIETEISMRKEMSEMGNMGEAIEDEWIKLAAKAGSIEEFAKKCKL